MKKIFALILATLMVFACVACGETNTDDTTANNDTTATDETPAAPVAENALEVLNKIYTSIPEENRFPVAGGFGDNMDWSNPGEVPADNEEAIASVAAQLQLTTDIVKRADSIANALNPMNTNMFAAGAFHVTDGNVQSFADACKESIANAQWMCGFPEKLVVIAVGDYAVVAFGLAGLDDPMANFIGSFVGAAETAYTDAEILVDENLFA